MAREDALLTRLEVGTGSGRARQDATTVENVEALMASVRMNLTNILNSRHGMSEALPDYGLPALSDFTMSNRNYILVLQEAIRTAISKYEPRLDRVKVSFRDPGSDPDVERLLEGVAFLCGRIREKLDDELPELTASMMSLLWPHYLRPIPSMTILELLPDIDGMQAAQTVAEGSEFASVPID